MILLTSLLLLISMISLVLLGVFIERERQEDSYAFAVLSSILIFAITFTMGMNQFSKICSKSVATKARPVIEYKIHQIDGRQKADTTYVYKF